MGGVRTLKWEGFGHWGGRVLDIGERRVGHRGEGVRHTRREGFAH